MFFIIKASTRKLCALKRKIPGNWLWNQQSRIKVRATRYTGGGRECRCGAVRFSGLALPRERAGCRIACFDGDRSARHSPPRSRYRYQAAAAVDRPTMTDPAPPKRQTERAPQPSRCTQASVRASSPPPIGNAIGPGVSVSGRKVDTPDAHPPQFFFSLLSRR
eukprot:scaffold112638_cov27-Tisochrysis_lutea.AAC.1